MIVSAEPKVTYYELPTRSKRVGQPVLVGITEVTIEDFAAQLPELSNDPLVQLGLASTADRQIAWDQWVNRLLAKAIAEPEWLRDPEKIRFLGPDRELLCDRVFKSWGISTEPVYQGKFLTMVRRMARFKREWPTELMKMPITLFWTNYMILFGDPDDLADA